MLLWNTNYVFNPCPLFKVWLRCHLYPLPQVIQWEEISLINTLRTLSILHCKPVLFSSTSECLRAQCVCTDCNLFEVKIFALFISTFMTSSIKPKIQIDAKSLSLLLEVSHISLCSILSHKTNYMKDTILFFRKSSKIELLKGSTYLAGKRKRQYIKEFALMHILIHFYKWNTNGQTHPPNYLTLRHC